MTHTQRSSEYLDQWRKYHQSIEDGWRTARPDGVDPAAAPKLLAVLQLLHDDIKPIRQGERNGAALGMLSRADDIAQLAIAKATGG